MEDDELAALIRERLQVLLDPRCDVTPALIEFIVADILRIFQNTP